MRTRAKGVIGVMDTKPSGSLWEQAQRILKAKADAAAARRAERDSRPVPNYIAYAFLFPNYDPKTGRGAPSPLPKCRRCGDAVLHPQEHHACDGFKAKFVERDGEWKERQQFRRESIRESRAPRPIVCSVCGEEMPEPEDGEWHWQEHEGRPEREHLAVNGDEDDMSGYEDESEEDWCADDDGWCE